MALGVLLYFFCEGFKAHWKCFWSKNQPKPPFMILRSCQSTNTGPSTPNYVMFDMCGWLFVCCQFDRCQVNIGHITPHYVILDMCGWLFVCCQFDRCQVNIGHITPHYVILDMCGWLFVCCQFDIGVKPILGPPLPIM